MENFNPLTQTSEVMQQSMDTNDHTGREESHSGTFPYLETELMQPSVLWNLRGLL